MLDGYVYVVLRWIVDAAEYRDHWEENNVKVYSIHRSLNSANRMVTSFMNLDKDQEPFDHGDDSWVTYDKDGCIDAMKSEDVNNMERMWVERQMVFVNDEDSDEDDDEAEEDDGDSDVQILDSRPVKRTRHA